MSTVKEHLATPHVTTAQYVKSRVVELGASLDGKIAVYLDTRFWIILRKASLSESPEPAALELLRLLRALSAKGKLFCPASEGIFYELLKQSDPQSRLATARLIDELSLGVTLLNIESRVATEVSHFFHMQMFGEDRLHPIRHLVWSKLAYVLGLLHPTSTPFDADTEQAIQKAFFDHMWTIPLSTIVELTGISDSNWGLDLSDSAERLTRGAAQHAASLRSFEHTLEEEMRGVADLLADQGVAIIAEIMQPRGVEQATGQLPPPSKLRNFCANVIFHTLKNANLGRKHLPILYVEASLHAAVRWDKQRPMRGNDLYDFAHAASALAYCQAFFTEGPLHRLLDTRPLKLRESYSCFVASDILEAVGYLKTL